VSDDRLASNVLQRYSRAFRHAWQQRRSATPAPRQADEIAFLPAHLDLQERPANPMAGYLQRITLAIFLLALLWACLGYIDVVATASGKIVPSGKSKLVQANDVAQVRTIHVEDGQFVFQGELLIELDDRATQADVNRLDGEWLAARVDTARAQALLEAIDHPDRPLNLALIGTAEQQAAARRWLDGQHREYRSELEQARADIAQLDAQWRSAKVGVAALEQTLPITRRLLKDLGELAAMAAIPRHQFLQREQQRLEQERELGAQRLRVEELTAALAAARARREGRIAQARRSMLDLLNEANQRAASLYQELEKAQRRQRLQRIVAPVDGTVQQLAIHTAGGTVKAAQPLLIIVPSDHPVEVEARLSNKDVGFVKVGQPVEIKVETFNFTRYGIARGTVSSISDDAIEDEREGPYYSVRIHLLDRTLWIGDVEQSLSPGMAVSAEIKTDRRRLISYFLSPLRQVAGSSLKER
jgi:hemolysin D